MRGYFLGGSIAHKCVFCRDLKFRSVSSETFQMQRAFQRASSAWSCPGNWEHHCGEVFCEGPRTEWYVSSYFLHSLPMVPCLYAGFPCLAFKTAHRSRVVQLSTWFFGIWSSLLCGCVGRITAVMQNLGNRAAFLVVQCWSELQVHCTLLSSLTYLSIHTVHIALFSNPLPVFPVSSMWRYCFRQAILITNKAEELFKPTEMMFDVILAFESHHLSIF